LVRELLRGRATPTRPLRLPLSGEDLYVTTEHFQLYSKAAERFVEEIVNHFEARENECYPRGR
jgi:hypothetical protein